ETTPLLKARSSCRRFSKRDPIVPVAVVMRDAIALSAAASTAGTIDAVASEPPEVGPSGSDVSPRATSTLSCGTPVLCDASCARLLYVPVPMSCVAQATRTVPSARNSTVAAAGNRAAIHAQPAIPQPNVTPSRFIEPTAGLRLDQPNFSVPSSKHSSKWRDENGTIRRSTWLNPPPTCGSLWGPKFSRTDLGLLAHS